MKTMWSFTKDAFTKFQKVCEEKNRGDEPWNEFDEKFLLNRLKEEILELEVAIQNGNRKEILDECYDVANFAWFIRNKYI